MLGETTNVIKAKKGSFAHLLQQPGRLRTQVCVSPVLFSCLTFSCPSIVGQENVRQENKAKTGSLF